ncbi:M20/M25/M40 family metallo-hydrolase [Luteimonas sp. RD2P54]|uniref:Carboxypeptidase Q n=1 Tax=Luteimonas endophytica TaxID=3042023 RepID=A0ABT6J635_9GAMM|nr:M28 family peptidase [Luteimonas endophytica]MDH5822285.1 M20/M25/M40 family metallo-hydrolase [Luteimonas endophytica]
MTPHRPAMRRAPPVLGCLIALLAAAAPAPAADRAERTAARLRDQALAGEAIAYGFVSELTTRFGPRPAGSAAEHAAADWAAARLRALGFDRVAIEPFPLVGWTRGEESAEIVGAHPQRLAAAALGGSPATPASGIEGEVVPFDSLEALRAAPVGSLEGRIVLLNQRMPRVAGGYGALVPGRLFAPGEAADRGAVALLLRSLGTGTARFAHVGSTRYRDGRVPLPSFALAGADADQIERLLALGETVRVRLHSQAAHVDTHSQNVVAELHGREAPDEVIVLAAHLDSWDAGTGAIDDGAGVAIVVAAAELIARLPQRPRRSLRVVLYGAEEVAQPHTPETGGAAYLARHAAEVGDHVLAMESDFGAGAVQALSLPPGVAASDFGRALYRVLTPMAIVPSREPPGRGGVDIAPLVEAGVPAFVLRQDGSRYFDFHHTADDTLDKIDRAELDQNVAAWAALAWLAAQTGADFRALSAAEPAE